ncbi:MAG TPA: winged helix-turn-helix domain-containing protein [Terriglobales bacterium]|nr:winged helix-turn-helix domain-containing protein [Terriglobales bacterium]
MADLAQSQSLIRFAGFEVDLSSGELRKNGVRIRLPEQSFQILVMLVLHSGKVVSREDLRKKLWPSDTYVDFDAGLNSAILRLRNALGDSAETPRFVETLPKRGYRFIAQVDTVPRTEQSPTAETAAGPIQKSTSSRQRNVKLAVAMLVLAVVLITTIGLNVGRVRERLLSRRTPLRIQSVAVLPLENLTGDPTQEYFADGMTDALITDLAQISALRVISRTSAMQYKAAKKPLKQIARELDVDAIVEGTVVRSGDRVRIDAQLIEAATDQHLWAKSYERDIRDIVALQAEVAQSIANEIQIRTTPQEKARLATARPVNPVAYEAYLKGIFYANKRTEDSIRKSTAYFEQAVGSDPQDAPAFAGLAGAYVLLGFFGAASPQEAYPKAKVAAAKALVLDESLAPAHEALAGTKLWYDWVFMVNESGSSSRARSANPNRQPEGAAVRDQEIASPMGSDAAHR